MITLANNHCDAEILGGITLPADIIVDGEKIAFGLEAARYIRSFPNDISIIACDGTHAPLALAEAVRRRRQGIPTLIAPLLTEMTALVMRAYAYVFLTHDESADAQRAIFEAAASGKVAIGDRELAAITLYAPALVATMRELMRCGEALLVRSQGERTRLFAQFGRVPQYIAVVPGFDHSLPPVTPADDAHDIVVWAPNEQAESLALYAYALGEFCAPATFICQGQLANSRHRFLNIDEATMALRRAAVVIDANLANPGTALSLAGRGFGVVCAETSGAHEFLQGALTYQPTNFASIIDAVSRARGDRRARVSSRPADELTLRETLFAAATQIPIPTPLVSIIIPTFNRPELLRKSLEHLQKQTYPNLEVLVINDCGADVSAIVAEFAFARYLCTPKNSGVNVTINLGLRAARGVYLAAIADDDLYYPDFIAGAVAALIASRVKVAHGDIVVALERLTDAGQAAVGGYLLAYDGSHDPTAAHWSMPNSAQGYLIHRDAWAKIGYFSEYFHLNADHDLTLKLSREHDFVHVARLGGQMGWRTDGSNSSAARGSAHADEVARVLSSHVPADRPLIAARVAQTVESVRIGMQRQSFFQAHMPLATPIPV